MQKVTKILFAIADVALAIMLLSGVVALIQIFFAFLDLTFPGSSGEGREVMDVVLALMGLPSLLALSYLLLALAVLFTLVYMFSFILLLRKQVLGLAIMLVLDLAGLLLWPIESDVLFVTAIRWLILGLPWLLTVTDLRRRGKLAQDDPVSTQRG